MNITSAAGVLALLDESRYELKMFALKKLNRIVDEFWAEISFAIDKIKTLHEDETFPGYQLAALVASKVFFHLGAFEDSVRYALGAGELFDINCHSDYYKTIKTKCIDFYTDQRIKLADDPEYGPIDIRLQDTVDKMFQKCQEDRQFQQAVGLALDTRRMDIFEASIMESDDIPGMLEYGFQMAVNFIKNRRFRNFVLRSLVDLHYGSPTPNNQKICQCLILLDDPFSVAHILEVLVRGNEESQLMAYQIAFDLYESVTQQFVGCVLAVLREIVPIPHLLDRKLIPKRSPSIMDLTADPDERYAMDYLHLNTLPQESRELQLHVDKIYSILLGTITINLHLKFLIHSNHADLSLLMHIKEVTGSSICHTATVIANGYMYSGTTSDTFLEDNLSWLSRTTNWAKLTATASLGVIHRGHEQKASFLMQIYLPRGDEGACSGYFEGGILYAIGLTYANNGATMIDYLVGKLRSTQNEVIRLGGCLGLGLAAMGTHRQDVYEHLRFNLYQNNAATGEAAGIAMGMVMLGLNNEDAIKDMLVYAQESQHEKIQRGLAVGIALIMYERLEEADQLITQLITDKDPILRRTGMYTLAMAYCGTGCNQGIQKLLHAAVSDANDDVRRAAVTSLGFLLFRTPEKCPELVALMVESYNPHVRYGAAMALGIACAGTGLHEAITLLEPMMLHDPDNFVRQGALIASAMILIQHTEHTFPRVTFFREKYVDIIASMHEHSTTKFGAILAQGIINGGGRNVTLSLLSHTGHTNIMAVVGVLVFTQYWYWFPLSHFLSLAFTPTCVIGLNAQLQMPRLEFKSIGKPSAYAYPGPLVQKKEGDEDYTKVPTAVLSVTARKCQASTSTEKQDVDTSQQQQEEEAEQEPTYQILSNPARVMRQQLKGISIVEAHHVAIKDVTYGGIIMMRSLNPCEEKLTKMAPLPRLVLSSDDDSSGSEPIMVYEWMLDGSVIINKFK